MLAPMLASLMDAPLDDPNFVYEPKYDGIRAIVEVDPKGSVHLWSRLGNEKTHQFPEITAALRKWGRKQKAPVVLDGEIVALDGKGEPTGFQNLQGRIHVTEGTATDSVALIAFDILRVGRDDLRDTPLLERRAVLERVFGKTGSPLLRISMQVRGDGSALYKEALAQGWEGLIAKQAASLYKSGKRTPDWRKLKIVHEQEFVIGGWTEPRHTRSYFGALLLGVFEDGRLIYAGHTGTGFNEKELARVMKLLKPLETNTSPFAVKPKTNERPHWAKPELVAQIKFTEWTADGKLRHPVYLGLRDDKKPADVRREEQSRVHAASRVRAAGTAAGGSDDLLDQLKAIESTRRDGILTLPDGSKLTVTNLHKIFWPKQRFTKGDLFRYYVRAAPYLLPVVADRPLVMKRYPNGIAGKWFYQHRVDDAPGGVRRERVTVAESREQIIGGTLLTLLYMTQLASISQDPWFSRVQHPQFADHVALDLDPADGVPFSQVLDVARWIRDELQTLGAVGVPKTSGASGLHIYIPLPPQTPYDAGLLFCQIIATVVAHKHPRVATVERAVKARGRRVYIDFMQNVLGKTLATAYSARASEYAGVSTPLTWKEVDAGVKREDFTIETVPERLKALGDVWQELRRAKGVDLSRVARYADR
ncbi:MAG TPA: DNA ligase D [Vicinamibacterales bacterium]|nr:DNA ligase D [Vicinamibacterales bacterium]